MTLDEAILHCETVAESKKADGCSRCAQDHIQLKKWLEELRDLRKIRRKKFIKEFAIRIGDWPGCSDTPDDDCRFHSVEEAQKRISKMEEADRAYDIPDPPKRTVVVREVSTWRKYSDEQ